MSGKPIVLVSACNTSLHVPGWGDLGHQTVFDRYLDFVKARCDAVPLILPAAPLAPEVMSAVLQDVDGVLLTGAASNVHPSHYDAEPLTRHFDERRDESSLGVVRAAFEMSLPLLGICRGMQEINVAFGGSLDQAVHEVAGRIDHRSRQASEIVSRYAPAHTITAAPGGWLASRLNRAAPGNRELQVNSAHAQGVGRLGAGLVAEAFAQDGTIEALRAAGVDFLVGVQWHIEWMEACLASSVIAEEFKQQLQNRHSVRMGRSHHSNPVSYA